jgi:hypothetical protein
MTPDSRVVTRRVAGTVEKRYVWRLAGTLMMHFHNDQTLEIVFGIRQGDHIRMEVLGLTCLDANTDWYRAQLNAEIHIHIGSFRGYRSLVMFSDDFHHFRDGLNKLRSGETIVAVLETGDFFSIDVRDDGKVFDVWMQLDALERDGQMVLYDGGAENWEWRFAVDRTALDSLSGEVTQVSNRYPMWSVPRH